MTVAKVSLLMARRKTAQGGPIQALQPAVCLLHGNQCSFYVGGQLQLLSCN